VTTPSRAENIQKYIYTMKMHNSTIQNLLALLFVISGALFFGLTFYPYLIQNFIKPNLLYQFYVTIQEYLFSWIVSIMAIVGGTMFLLKKEKSVILLNLVLGGIFLHSIYAIIFESGGRLGLRISIIIMLISIFCFLYFNRCRTPLTRDSSKPPQDR
jgi:hypothetical protein